jgi:Na+-transporting NADH:ubiquinone oxidoreductase subunit NqrB
MNGDVNGDGYDDVIVGAPAITNEPPGYPGKAYLYFGSATGLSETPAWTSSGEGQEQAFYGETVSAAGDVNGDGTNDLIVGCWGATVGGQYGAGYVKAFSLATAKVLSCFLSSKAAR